VRYHPKHAMERALMSLSRKAKLSIVGGSAAALAVAALISAGAVSAGTVASSSAWSAYYWNSSGNSLGGPQAAGTGTDSASAPFSPGYLALVTTSAKSLTGDLTGQTISVTVSVKDDPSTTWQYGGSTCGTTPPSVRLYFDSNGVPGYGGANGNGGFYTQFWWSNPSSATVTSITSSDGSATFTFDVPVNPAQWSDWNGQAGTTVPDAFATAAVHVKDVGLSFGGGCFFENGVTSANASGTFTLTGFSD
jgi:hypothetical protein